MLRSLNSGISGLQQFQERMDVIGNNIANVNTTGYKSARTDFADTFNQTLGTTKTGPNQVGYGVATSSIRNTFTQGGLARTEVPTDVAIIGNGFFMVEGPDGITGKELVTRAGSFSVSNDGYLVTSDGAKIIGTAAGGTDKKALNVATAGGQNVRSFAIGNNGVITLTMADGSTQSNDQLMLVGFPNEQALMKQGNNLYTYDAKAGTPVIGVPDTKGLGKVQAGALELSNVDLAGQFTDMIVTQRAFQATSKIISTSDEMLQEVINMKR